MITANCFKTFTQGSPPKLSVVAAIEQLLCPTQAFATTATLVAASHELFAKGPGQEPVGVPNEANVTPVKSPLLPPPAPTPPT